MADVVIGNIGIVKKSTKNPMISQTIIDLLNYRVEQEEYSARIYLAMSMWLDNVGYMGAAKLWRKYSNEEMGHADIARSYLLDLGVQPNTPALKSPQQTFKGLPEIIQLSYDHEIEVTRQIKDFASKAFKEGDFMVFTLTQKYLEEQVEEHGKTQLWLDRLNLFGSDQINLREMDEEMGDKA